MRSAARDEPEVRPRAPEVQGRDDEAARDMLEERAQEHQHPTPTDSGIDQPMDQDDGTSSIIDDGMSVGFLGSLQPSAKDQVSLMMLAQLGSYPHKSYLREKKAACRKIISEV